MLFHGSPASGQPVLRFVIAAVVDKLRILATGYEAIGERERLKPYAMPGHFIVKAKAVSCVAGFVQPAFEREELERALRLLRLFIAPFRCIFLAICRAQRIGKEGVQNIGEEKF